jgi:hypothetical protein
MCAEFSKKMEMELVEGGFDEGTTEIVVRLRLCRFMRHHARLVGVIPFVLLLRHMISCQRL